MATDTWKVSFKLPVHGDFIKIMENNYHMHFVYCR